MKRASHRARRQSIEQRVLAAVRAHEPISCAELKRRLGPDARGAERFFVIGRTCWTGLSVAFARALLTLVEGKQLWIAEHRPCKLSIRRDQ